jgi:hypothetical protein
MAKKESAGRGVSMGMKRRRENSNNSLEQQTPNNSSSKSEKLKRRESTKKGWVKRKKTQCDEVSGSPETAPLSSRSRSDIMPTANSEIEEVVIKLIGGEAAG